ncbi:MAG: flagellin [Thermoguttaceae bacterium]
MSVLAINNQAATLAATHQIQRTSSRLENTMTQMSTGYRINSGCDDPSGLIASELMRSDIVAANKAIQNTQRASSVVAIAESGMGQISALLNEAKGLVVEAANTGAMSPAMVEANQMQVDAILASVNRIATTTSYIDKPLLDGSMSTENGGATFQLGPSVVPSQQINIGIASVATTNLGGDAGILAELGTGGAASLASNPALADKIVGQAIGDVAFRRGELGTAQRVTFETNIAALQDYVVAVSGAEAAISNTDYATAASNAARDQILLTAGIKALAQTNRQMGMIASLLM